MPIYEYRCNDCQQVFEEWQKGFEDREMVCPVCAGISSRMISNSAFVLKGGGWYVTDYCNRQSSSGNGNGDGKSQNQEKSASAESSSSADSGSSSTSTSNNQAD